MARQQVQEYSDCRATGPQGRPELLGCCHLLVPPLRLANISREEQFGPMERSRDRRQNSQRLKGWRQAQVALLFCPVGVKKYGWRVPSFLPAPVSLGLWKAVSPLSSANVCSVLGETGYNKNQRWTMTLPLISLKHFWPWARRCVILHVPIREGDTSLVTHRWPPTSLGIMVLSNSIHHLLNTYLSQAPLGVFYGVTWSSRPRIFTEQLPCAKHCAGERRYKKYIGYRPCSPDLYRLV